MTGPERLSPEPETPAVERITATLIPRAARDLAELHRSTGQSRSELVNRAITLLAYVTIADDKGYDLMVRHSESGELTLVRLL